MTRSVISPRILSLLLFLLGAPALAAPLPVSGRVVGPGGRPLAGAVIELFPLSGPVQKPVSRSSSRPDGAFRLEAPETGMWTVRVSAQGYLPVETDLVPLVEPADLPSAGLKPAVDKASAAEGSGWRPAPRLGTTGPNGNAGKERSVEIADPRAKPVRGLVRDSKTGRPLAGALVWPEGRPAAFVRSGADGSYSIAPSVRLLAAATGYRPGSGPGPKIALIPKGLTGHGRVVDVSSHPVPGAAVSLLAAGGERELPASGSLLRIVADREGRFEVADLAAGSYDLRVAAPGFAPTLVRGVPVRAGAVDLGTVVLHPGAEIAGTVTDPDGQPIADATVRITPDSPVAVRLSAAGEEERKVVTGADGSFRLQDLAPGGPVSLKVWKTGYRPISQAVAMPTAEPVTIVLHPASKVAGRVLDEDGEPVSGARVVLIADQPGGRPGRMLSSAPTDEQGSFIVEGADPGPVRLVATAAGFLASQPKPVEIPEGEDLEGIEILLSQGAVVEGHVTGSNGRPLAGALVQVAPRPAPVPEIGLPTAQTGQDGAYRLEGVPPGRRSLSAEHPEHPSAVAEVEVRPGTNALDLRLEDGWEVSGQVVDGGGRPVPGARVTVSSKSSSRQAVSGADGAFRVTAVSEGRSRVEAEKEGYAPARPGVEVQVADGPVSGVEVRLDPGGAIVGRILGLGHEDLSRLEISASGPAGGAAGRIDPSGAYRVDTLPAGEWVVTAHLPGGRETHARVTLAPGAQEAALDLRFGGDLSLTGVVVQDGRPVPGAPVAVRRLEGGASGSGVSDPQGRFEVDGLEAGTYEVLVLRKGDGPFRQLVELRSDQDVVLDLAAAASNGL
jgi:protocatechuate 3,4-dioxygenase beta subunit